MRRRSLTLLGILLTVVPASATPLADLEEYRGETIAEIRLQGNRVTRDFVITREIWSEEGDPLDPDLVAQDITRLENLAIFGSVIASTSRVENGVQLDFEFTEMPSILFYPAVAWNEQNGFSGGVGVSSPNFLGRGMTLSAKAVFGGTTNFFFRGANPWIAGDHFSAEVYASHSERENTILEFDQIDDRVELDFGYYLGRHGRMRGSIGYRGVESDVTGITLNPRGRDEMLQLGLSLGYDSRDSWRVPHSGWHAEASTTWLAGDADTQEISLDARRYQPIADGHTLVIGPLASLQTGTVGAQIPSYQQYFLGGANSVRGYQLEELGKRIQGRRRLLLNSEYRWLVVPVRPLRVLKWSVAVGVEVAAFADLGTVWNDSGDFGPETTRFGYGLGARILFPLVEMIRFDLGVSEYGDLEFNFGIRSIFESRSIPLE